MQRIARILATLAFCCWAISGCSAGFEPGATGAAEQDIQFTCVKPMGDPQARYPWEATYPIGSQHVYCQHMVTETSPSAWPSNVGACTGNPNGQQIPGVYQVDVWVRDAGTPASYRCARVNVPQVGHYSLTYAEMMEMGWFSSQADGPHHRWIQAIYVGPGTQWLTSSDSDVFTHGCPVSPASACSSGVNWLDSHQAVWWQIDGAYQTTMSLNFQPVGCSYPSCD